MYSEGGGVTIVERQRLEALLQELQHENELFLALIARDRRGDPCDRRARAERLLLRQIGWAWGREAHALALVMVRELGMPARVAIEAANRGPVAFALSRVVV